MVFSRGLYLKVGIYESVAVYSFTSFDRQGRGEHRSCVNAGVKLAVFAAGIGTSRQIGKQAQIKLTTGKLPTDVLRVHACKPRPQSTCDHLLC